MKNIIIALNKAMQSAGYVQKNSENKFHGYKYASEADLLETLRPAMIEQGLVLIPSIGNVSGIDDHGNTRVFVEYTLAHTSGEIWPDKIMAVGCGNDRAKNGTVGDKGVYKAITGANKYLLFKLFQIETGDDPENDEVVSQPEENKDTGNSRKDFAPKPGEKGNNTKAKNADGVSATPEETEKYMQVFIAALEAHVDEKEIREFWKSEAKNRAAMSIKPDSENYKKLADACAHYIEKVKKNGL
jgi:hypothetical protein